jgi:tetratricopeptide (TPR) repeat protein
MAMERRMAMSAIRRRWVGLIFVTIYLAASLFAQVPAIRHHKIIVADPLFPPELTQAEAALEKNDYATAQPLLEKIVAANSANYQAWFDLGFLYNAEGKTDDSIAAYRKSVTAKPDVFESNLNLGLMLVKAGSPDAAQFLSAATGLKPTAHVDEGRARAWLSLAHVLEATKPAEAIAAYQEVARLQPKDPEPHLSAGLLLQKQGQPELAEQEYKQALALDNQSADAFTGMVNLYMQEKRFSEAEAMLRKLEQLRPDDTNVHLQLGRVLAAAGKHDDAIKELEPAAKAAPNDVALHRDLADLYLEAGKYDLAIAQYQPLVAATPNDFDLHMSFGRALLLQHEFPDAQREFILAIKLKSDSGEAYWQLAVAANENKDYPLTIQALDARAKLLPEVPLSYFLRATAFDHLHIPKLAAENYHHFLEVANGKYPDQEWQARHRLIAIEPKK